MFESTEEVREKLAGQEYVCDRRLATVVYLAVKLDKPVLVEGPAGVGKTERAKSLAAATDRTLIRLQCYEGLDEAKALYEWEYGKQLLYTQVPREKVGEVLGPTKGLRGAAATLREQEDVFFSENFLVERPTLQSITSEISPVLLLDEIDRADHVRQTIWITPEPKWGWSLGSCDMPAHEPICDRVEVVRSVDQLAGVAENLVRARA